MFKSWLVTKHKAVDLDVHIIKPSLTEPTRLMLGFDIGVSYNGDHSGCEFHLALVFIWINVVFYDTRHREDRE